MPDEYEEIGGFCSATNFLEPMYPHCPEIISNEKENCVDEQLIKSYNSRVTNNSYNHDKIEGL